MGLAVYAGQVYPSGPATSTRPLVNSVTRRQSPCPSTTSRWSSRPGRGSSAAPWGRSRYRRGRSSGQVSFTVTFDRPINPPGTIRILHPRRCPGLLPGYHLGDPSIPLDVLSVTPVTRQRRRPGQQVRLHRVHDHLQRHHQPDGDRQRHHELHRHLQLPDHARRRERQPDRGADPVVCLQQRHPAGYRPGLVGRRAPADPAPRGHGAPAPATTSRSRR